MMDFYAGRDQELLMISVFHLDYSSVAAFKICISYLPDVTAPQKNKKLNDRNWMLSAQQNKRSFSLNQLFRMFLRP